MDKELKIYFGKILSELYTLQNEIADIKHEKRPNDDYIIEGLYSKNEYIINQEFRSNEDYSITEEIYYKILEDVDTLSPEEIDGFYSIPSNIRDKYERPLWVEALKLMKAENRFDEILEKVTNNTNSPIEISNI